MLGDVFYWTLNMSIAAAICGVPVLLLRKIKKIPRRVICLLWAIPYLRMCIPLWITGRYSLMSLLARFTTRTVTVQNLPGDLSVTYMNHVMIAEDYFPVTYKVNLLGNLFSAASVVWLAIAAALVFTLGFIYRTTMREIRSAVPMKENVFVSDKVQSPAVYGIFRPKIILPQALLESDTTFILRHECAHIRRGDNLFRLIAFVLTAVHWFNPLCWLFLKVYLTDMELACDETVLAQCGGDDRKEYARTLLSSAEKTTVFVSPFGGAKIRTRIENVLSYKKMTVFAAIGFAALVLSAAYILLTNAI